MYLRVLSIVALTLTTVYPVYAEKAAVSEDARRSFIKGAAVSKDSRTPEQQALAVKYFQEAVSFAPGWSDALYNLAVAQELAGQYIDARATLKRYIETAPGEEEAREAQDRIYALEAKMELAETGPSAAATPFDGAVFICEEFDSPGVVLVRRTIAVSGNDVTLTDQRLIPAGLRPKVLRGTLEGLSCRFAPEQSDGMQYWRKLDISEDGRKAKVSLNWANGTTSTFDYKRKP